MNQPGNNVINQIVNNYSSLLILQYLVENTKHLGFFDKDLDNSKEQVIFIECIKNIYSYSKIFENNISNMDEYYSANLLKLVSLPIISFERLLKNKHLENIVKSNFSNIDKNLKIDNLEENYKNTIQNLLLSTNEIEDIRVYLLGKNGVLTIASKNLGKLNQEERKLCGNFLNLLKNFVNSAITLAKKEQLEKAIQEKIEQESIDVTLPVYNSKQGAIHPLTYVLEEVVGIFNNMGFSVEEGPEIENDWNNFTALNFSEDHPAKDSHDTFYFKSEDNNPKLLRTHTSTVQIRSMSKDCNLPLKIIAPGKVYRSDDDATHTPMFHQIEGLYINKNVSVAELKFVLTTFCEKFFGIKNIPLRFRPSYFPFTSPSLEVDIGCSMSKNGVIIGKGNDWLEILGSGMVHPNVLKNCNIDNKIYKGFAFGMGIERIAMLKYGFPDLREFFSSNYLWLKSYNFNVIKTLFNNFK